MNKLDIRYLSRNQIDTEKWDLCMAHAVNGAVFGYSWFLDIVAPSWGALVANDYQIVLPLAQYSKFGIDIIFKPKFARYLGPFSPFNISNEMATLFFKTIPKTFRFIEVDLSPFVFFDIHGAECTTRSTYNIDLIERSSVLMKNYSDATKNKLHRATAAGIKVFQSNALSHFFDLISKTHSSQFNQAEKDIIKRMVSQSLSKGVGHILGAYTARNELCAAAFFITANKKTHCMLLVANSEGVEYNALYAIVDSYCNANAETNTMLEFDAMGRNEIENMFLGFGMTATQYKSITINRLHWIYKKVWALKK